MKDKNQFLAILLSTVICVLTVSVITYAATTIGTNITAEGTIAINGSTHSTELSVIGTASISEDLWASGSFQFAGGEGTATVSYSRLGTATTGHSLVDAYDLLVSGMLEIDGIAYFDSSAVFGDIASANYGLIVDSMLQVGHGASVAYSRFGSGTTGHSLDAANDLLISADLEVDGTAYFDGVASMSGTMWTDTIYGAYGDLYLRIGDAGTTGHSLTSEDDLLVTGKLEVDGTAYFDSTVSVSSSGLLLDEGIAITTGTASVSGACGTTGSLYIRSGQASIDSVLSVCGSDGAWNPADL